MYETTATSSRASKSTIVRKALELQGQKLRVARAALASLEGMTPTERRSGSLWVRELDKRAGQAASIARSIETLRGIAQRENLVL